MWDYPEDAPPGDVSWTRPEIRSARSRIRLVRRAGVTRPDQPRDQQLRVGVRAVQVHVSAGPARRSLRVLDGLLLPA